MKNSADKQTKVADLVRNESLLRKQALLENDKKKKKKKKKKRKDAEDI